MSSGLGCSRTRTSIQLAMLSHVRNFDSVSGTREENDGRLARQRKHFVDVSNEAGYINLSNAREYIYHGIHSADCRSSNPLGEMIFISEG